jgi:hypothetical protein
MYAPVLNRPLTVMIHNIALDGQCEVDLQLFVRLSDVSAKDQKFFRNINGF